MLNILRHFSPPAAALLTGWLTDSIAYGVVAGILVLSLLVFRLRQRPDTEATSDLTIIPTIMQPGRPVPKQSVEVGIPDLRQRDQHEIEMPAFRSAQIAQEWFGRDPIPYLVGHDPQKLLPSRERVFRDALASEWIDFDAARTGRFAGKMIDFQHIYGGPRHGWPHKRAVIVVGADYGDLEARILAASSIPGVCVIELDMQAPRGELYVLKHGQLAEMFAKPEKAVKQNGRSASYLDHDPTKKHRRRK